MSTQIDFSKKRCLPCEGIGRAMTQGEIAENIKNIPGWTLGEDKKSIEKSLTLKNFVQVVDMINLIKNIAEEEGHHPDLHLTGYKHLKIVLYTHAVDGLTENDFILASKINQLG
jgi:4a-hydroxytetrahydrobiopterin dehydratase